MQGASPVAHIANVISLFLVRTLLLTLRDV